LVFHAADIYSSRHRKCGQIETRRGGRPVIAIEAGHEACLRKQKISMNGCFQARVFRVYPATRIP